jgi:hypothetical protein
MKARSSILFVVTLAVVASVTGALLLRQHQEAILIGAELDRAKMQRDDLARLQAENQRLRGRQIPEAELARLRADHAALLRLRAELENLKKK